MMGKVKEAHPVGDNRLIARYDCISCGNYWSSDAYKAGDDKHQVCDKCHENCFPSSKELKKCDEEAKKEEQQNQDTNSASADAVPKSDKKEDIVSQEPGSPSANNGSVEESGDATDTEGQETAAAEEGGDVNQEQESRSSSANTTRDPPPTGTTRNSIAGVAMLGYAMGIQSRLSRGGHLTFNDYLMFRRFQEYM